METSCKVCYLAGPIRGMKNFNWTAFAQAEKRWTEMGWKVINPLRIEVERDRLDIYTAVNTVGSCITTQIRSDLNLLLTADAIVMLDGWRFSQGASFELRVALQLGIDHMDEHGAWIPRNRLEAMGLADNKPSREPINYGFSYIDGYHTQTSVPINKIGEGS